MLKINFYVCVSDVNRNIYKCVKSIANQNNLNKIELCIIENSKKSIINKFQIEKILKSKNIKIKFYIEKKIGIPFARNKCLEIIRKSKSDLSCFIDDDCELPRNWLKNMLKMYKKNTSLIITGPQISKTKNIYEVVLERKVNHNERLKWAATNNVLIDTKIIQKNLIQFDEDLKNLGGSDQLFFLKLYLGGSNIIWNKYSPVFEKRDIYKSNFYWFVKRNARYGSSSKIIYSKLYSPLKAISFTFLKFIYEFLKSFYYLTLFPFSPKKNFLYFIQFLVRSLSTLLSILNIRFNEYKT